MESLVVHARYSLDYCKKCLETFRVDERGEVLSDWKKLDKEKSKKLLRRRNKRADRLVRRLDRLGNWKKDLPD